MASPTSPAVSSALADLSSSLNDTFRIARGPIHGWSNHVYELKSSQGVHFILRIPKDAYVAKYVSKGLDVLRKLNELHPSLGLQAVVHQTDEYHVLTFLKGEELKSWNAQQISVERRKAILDGLAELLYAMWTTKLSADIQLTYREWLLAEVDRGLLRALEGTSSWGDPVHYLYRRAKINEIVPQHDTGNIAIKYGYMHSLNLIINESGLSGVVDWDDARSAPAPAAIQHPLFIAGIPGWRTDTPKEMTFEEDRLYLEEAVAKLDVTGGKVTHLLRASFERQFFEMSLHNRLVNEEYVRQRLQDASSALSEAAVRELDDFVRRHQLTKEMKSLGELRDRLNKIL